MKKFSNYIERNKSVITGKENLEHLYTIKDFPVFFGCVNTPKEDDIMADMEWAIDPETGVMQLTKLIPQSILYKEQHVDGCGPTWEKYYDVFSGYIVEQDIKSVLEVGGGGGQIADRGIKKSSDITWTIVEPNPIHKGNKRVKIVSSLFNKNLKLDYKVDAIVMSQSLEHMYEPREFLDEIASFLKPGGKLIIAYPNLELWLRNKFTNSINFEHTMLLTDKHLDYMFPEHGFNILNKKEYEDHSFFYTAEKVEGKTLKSNRFNMYNEYKKIFMDFVNYHLNMVKELNEKIEASPEPVYLFGAHIFSTYLISFGLNTEKIEKIVLDNSETKKGKRLYTTDFIADSPKILKDKGKVNVILKAGVHNEGIMKDILENINNEVVFW